MTGSRARATVGSTHEVEAAAAELFARGNAVDAAMAGLLAAAALHPSVLLGPVQILVGGMGAGLHAFDGRVRQPGEGAPRPRGFVRDEEVPDAARIGVPWLPATVAVALASVGRSSFADVAGPATALAKGTPRADLFGRFAARGARALEERPISSALLGAAGRQVSGLLTADDLASPRPAGVTATRGRRRSVATLPWAHHEDDLPVPPVGAAPPGETRAIVAVDRHGLFALALWEEASEGLALDELGLRAPFAAEPVRRGQTRARPGEPRPAPAALALVGPGPNPNSVESPELAFAAFGAGDAYQVLRGAVEAFEARGQLEAHGEARLVAASHIRGSASTFRA